MVRRSSDMFRDIFPLASLHSYTPSMLQPLFEDELMTTGLEAGRLTQRITLQVINHSTGPLGEPLPGIPVDMAKVWAAAEMVSNRKIRTLDQQQVVETWHFTIRSGGPAVTTDWKVRWKEANYTVVSVDHSRTDRLVLKAERDARHD
ncbi:phage head closure protein [uncultured Erwinia sp.]|uniref:phage head closure protein n=1 Tax=uncultured Erwinia sp. TaxID=246798 RepID=UPI00338D8060